MSEILFYHLSERTLEQVLPGLVVKSLERDWRVVIQSGEAEKLEALDALLWTFRDNSFVPHGRVRDGREAQHPVWLTAQDDNPNAANVRFLIEGAQLDEVSAYQRVVYLFDGHDNVAVEQARERWKFHKKNENEDVVQTYWKQNAAGGWEKGA